MKNFSYCNSTCYKIVKPVLWSTFRITTRHLKQDLSSETGERWLRNLIHVRELVFLKLIAVQKLTAEQKRKNFHEIVGRCSPEDVESVVLESNKWSLTYICSTFKYLKKISVSVSHMCCWFLPDGFASLIGGLQNLEELKLDKLHEVGLAEYLLLIEKLASSSNFKRLRVNIFALANWSCKGIRAVATTKTKTNCELGKHFNAISQLKDLEKLDVSSYLGCYMKEKKIDLSFLQGFTRLKELHAPSNVEHFPLLNLPNLEKLNLTEIFLDEGNIQNIGSLTSLTSLDVSNRFEPTLTIAAVSMIAGLTSLRELYLDRTRLTDEGMVLLQNLTNLVKLNISNTR